MPSTQLITSTAKNVRPNAPSDAKTSAITRTGALLSLPLAGMGAWCWLYYSWEGMHNAVPRRSPAELKALEAVEGLLDRLLVRALRALADPGPLLDAQLLLLAVGLEVDGGDDLVAEEHGEREIAEASLRLGDVGLEDVVVVEEESQPLALQDQRIEGREDVDQAVAGAVGGRSGAVERRFEITGPSPALHVPSTL